MIIEEKDNMEWNADVKPLIRGYEWGPGVPGIVIKLQDEITGVVGKGCVVTVNGIKRAVTDCYLSDGLGHPYEEPTPYIYIALKTTNLSDCGCPFVYHQDICHNKWAQSYMVSIDDMKIMIEGEGKVFSFQCDCKNSFLTPQYDLFNKRGTYSGIYYNAYTKSQEEVTLYTAAYEPEHLRGGEKNPLIIWLHGAGEGGVDPAIAIYGNQVTAFTEEPIQSYFKAGNQTGAYVLVVQCPTYWMDEGDGTNGLGSGDSRYLKILMDTIEQYVNSNSDIDTKRIYLGGCSNGGYMTLEMLINYPAYFAAAFPICVAYSYACFPRNEKGEYLPIPEQGFTKEDFDTLWLTDEKVEILKNKPLWFVQAANDQDIDPIIYGLPVYQAIIKAGNHNCWYSYFENVLGTDSPGEEYRGHWSWIHVLHDHVKGVQNVEQIINGTLENGYGFIPDNDNGGGNSLAKDEKGTYNSLFAWLSAQ